VRRVSSGRVDGHDVPVTTVEAAAPRRWHAEYAWLAPTWAQSPVLPGNGDQEGLARDVLIEAHGDRFTAVTPACPPPRFPRARCACLA